VTPHTGLACCSPVVSLSSPLPTASLPLPKPTPTTHWCSAPTLGGLVGHESGMWGLCPIGKGLRRGESIKEEGENNPNERMELKETNKQREQRNLKADGQRKSTPWREYATLTVVADPDSKKSRGTGKIKPEKKETETRMDKNPGARHPTNSLSLATYGLKPMIASCINGLKVQSSSARGDNLGAATTTPAFAGTDRSMVPEGKHKSNNAQDASEISFRDWFDSAGSSRPDRQRGPGFIDPTPCGE